MTLRPVAPGVLVATSRRDRMNTVVLLGRAPDGDGIMPALLVDPGWMPDELEGLAGALAARGLRPVAGFSTHAHFDHLLWHPRFGDGVRWAAPGTAATALPARARLLAELGPGYPRSVLDRFARVAALAAPAVPWPGPRVVVLRHDAHEPGSAALWLPGARVLIAGDLLSDIEVPLLGPGPAALPQYRDGLRQLAPFVRAAAVLVPGHGSPTRDAPARLAADLRYLAGLEGADQDPDPRLADPAMRAAHDQQRRGP